MKKYFSVRLTCFPDWAKIAVFRSAEKSVNYLDILDCRVSSGQATGIEIVYLTLSKNGDYADIDINPQKLVFFKNGNFSPQFLSDSNIHQLSELALKNIFIN